MSYEDHLKTCDYCNKGSMTMTMTLKPTIRIKFASSKPTIYIKSPADYKKQKKLTELSAIIRGASYSPISIPARTKGASSEVTRKPGPIEREVKLKELGNLVRG